MQFKVNTIHNEDIRLEYYIFPGGPRTVVCLHGHGRTVHDFEFIANEQNTVIAIHLFYHGNSYFPIDRIETNTLQYTDFSKLFKKILELEQVEDFDVFAFSQGGRFALCLYPEFAPRITSLTLIAPDGMDNGSFYNWASRQRWARKVFQKHEENPEKLLYYADWAKRLKIMRPKVRDFVHEFAANPKTFQKASHTWRAFRDVRPDYLAIKETLKKYTTPFKLIMGEYDQVIRPKQAIEFLKKIEAESALVVISNGHNFFKPSSVNKYVDLLPFMQH